LIATLDDAVRRYPNDPELWYMLGDARYHAGSLAGVPARASLEAFDRAIALDSAFTPSYVHAIPLSLEYGGEPAGRRYAQAFLTAGAMGTYAQGSELVLQLLNPATRSAAISYLADSADAHLFQTVWLAVGRWLDSAETPVALARARVAAEKRSGKQTNFAVFTLPVALASRGHIKEAAPLTTLPVLIAQFAAVGAFPRDSVVALARAWGTARSEGRLFSAALLAAQRDTAGLRQAMRSLDSVRQRPLPPQVPPIVREVLGYIASITPAYLALARSDSAEALRLFDARPDSACFGLCHIDDLVHAQLLAARGRLADAARRLDRPTGGFNPGLLPMEVLRALERGRVYERLGNRERAIEGYTLVLQAWRNPDPELQPYVAEARAAVQRLSGEKASSAESR
jgi:tetratricopeptide (TPR) repeat protein